MTEQTPIEAASAGLVWNGKVLLVRRGREPAKGLYAFPGGKVNAGESAEAAARRELREETGLEAGELRLVRTIEPGESRQTRGYRLHVFAGIHAGGDPVAGDDADEAGWFGADELGGLPITPGSLEIARLLLAGT